MKIEVYTDGSATIATKPGGWAWVLVIDGVKHSEGSGRMENATNNDAELESAIMGLAAVLKEIGTDPPRISYSDQTLPEITLVSDSQIILRWANGTQRFKQQKKVQKYKQLQFLMHRLNAQTRWVRGHSGDEHNNRCDRLANWARKGIEEPKPQVKKKKNIVNVKFGIAVNDSLLYDMCKEAKKHADCHNDSLVNNWMEIFTQKLKEQMENTEYFSVKART
jgi:ribonuclease HI